jgi:uncharacterized protein YndB with AHSA1/START domain
VKTRDLHSNEPDTSAVRTGAGDHRNAFPSATQPGGPSRTAPAARGGSQSCVRARRLVSALLVAAFATQARAEVKQAAADTFLIVFSQHLQAAPSKVYEALPKVEQWWSSEHTYSGNAANLSLSAQAGACFCERWKDGSVEHGTVILVMRDQILRIQTALGPLQSKAVTGILTFQVKPDGEGATLTTGYRVNGAAESALDHDAPNVDQVLGAQLARLARLIETGKADAK